MRVAIVGVNNSPRQALSMLSTNWMKILTQAVSFDVRGAGCC